MEQLSSFSVSFLLPVSNSDQLLSQNTEYDSQSGSSNNSDSPPPLVASTVPELTSKLRDQLGITGKLYAYRLVPVSDDEALDPSAKYAVAADQSGMTLDYVAALHSEFEQTKAELTSSQNLLHASLQQLSVERTAFRDSRTELAALERAQFLQLVDTEQRLMDSLEKERELNARAEEAEARAHRAGVAVKNMMARLRELAAASLEADFTEQERETDPAAQILQSLLAAGTVRDMGTLAGVVESK